MLGASSFMGGNPIFNGNSSDFGSVFGSDTGSLLGMEPYSSRSTPAMRQASAATMKVAAGMPKGIADSMLFGLGIAQWANDPQNSTDIFDQPEFVGAYNDLFAPGSNTRIGNDPNANLDPTGRDPGGWLNYLADMLANNGVSSLDQGGGGLGGLI